MNRLPVRRALVSVSDKAGLVGLGSRLHSAGVEIVSSGGTARALRDAGVPVTPLSEVTGVPEMLGGRVKTLHPVVHGGILADLDSPEHRADLEALGIESFQLVVVNLYPFEETVATDPSSAEVIEQIDVGGPTMIRAAAKNHAWVAVAVSPDRYDAVADAIEQGGTTLEFRVALAKEAFYLTSAYDAAIVNWLERDGAEHLVLPLEKVASLRYGENPHQAAAMYATRDSHGWWARAEQLQGKEMSFNNYADADAAWRLVNDLPVGSVAILKHMNACGAAVGDTIVQAFERAWECDPLSAFGSIVALNGTLDADAAVAIGGYFVEVVIALEITDAARVILGRKKNLRVLIAPPPSPFTLDMRAIDDGYLIQTRDVVRVDAEAWGILTRKPVPSELRDLEMAWAIAAHTKSNAIVLVNDGAAVGIGAGDQSRVGAAERALAKAGDRARGAACASDAYFPFRDGPDLLASAGVAAIVEPGGSLRDGEVIDSAREHGVALMFTGERHFRH
ncbi:MAG: bifunctional phosphoribosylaminoimidazolecarboxamide formyltransferase/IMP cyclohydrolase [Actinomycetota bacterium]|nr:bifunctional phosphoribosylaminoimidazolecarboxamide formyltransferase/IMP cyclohydrolase [Actinomycetota bacterium]